MENIKFLSVKFQEVEIRIKIQKYKITICILWLMSLSFFLSLMYFNNLNKQYEKNINLKKAKASSTKEEIVSQKFDTINSFMMFYKGINNNNVFNNNVFNNIAVNNSEIKLDVLLDQKNTFYDVVFNLEHSSKYIIKDLSPINGDNNKSSYKITLEVKK